MHQPNILVLDNDPIEGFSDCEFLRDSGFDVTGVHCAAAAFGVIYSLAPLLALVIGIPVGAEHAGLEVVRHARAAHPGLAIVYVFKAHGRRYLVEDDGGPALVCKPFRPEQLAEVLNRVRCLAATNSTSRRSERPLASGAVHEVSLAMNTAIQLSRAERSTRHRAGVRGPKSISDAAVSAPGRSAA
jgi:DNA-binding response OmpR family regulator